ncbi:hypothetical protein AVEN_28652-1 [Araneus ventricosus]|uniref:Uncharacterized protein n=1 Tax=Araneus ventricosus TaxID=182803 RepID=A0A4Y2FJE0_ARAVE|nr:hypothetical protein AVEN_28652-1 [Araneus ventricosus]
MNYDRGEGSLTKAKTTKWGRRSEDLFGGRALKAEEGLHGQENPYSSLQATILFPSYLYRFRLHHSGIWACGEKGDPLHYATSCHMTLSYHFTKPSAENTQLWWKSLLSNKLSRINITKLISFLTENKNLIKQPPDAASSSDSDPDFSSSPRPETYRLRTSRGSIPRTLISPPTSI